MATLVWQRNAKQCGACFFPKVWPKCDKAWQSKWFTCYMKMLHLYACKSQACHSWGLLCPKGTIIIWNMTGFRLVHTFYPLFSSLILFHLLSSWFILCHPVSHSFILFYSLSFPFLNFYPLSPSTMPFQPNSTVFFLFHPIWSLWILFNPLLA